MTTCSECGTEFCASIAHDVPAHVAADSQDIEFADVCPWCWMRGANDRLRKDVERLTEGIRQAQHNAAGVIEYLDRVMVESVGPDEYRWRPLPAWANRPCRDPECLDRPHTRGAGGCVDADPDHEGAPVVTLGFIWEELRAMENLAFPDPLETWLHGLVAAVISGRIAYRHLIALDSGGGDASRWTPLNSEEDRP